MSRTVSQFSESGPVILKRGKSKRKNGAHLPAKRPGASLVSGCGSAVGCYRSSALLALPASGELQRVLASPRAGERCREATERGALDRSFPPLRRCRASSPHAAARGEPRGRRSQCHDQPSVGGGILRLPSLAQDDSAAEGSPHRARCPHLAVSPAHTDGAIWGSLPTREGRLEAGG